jgi:hypothetical protein
MGLGVDVEMGLTWLWVYGLDVVMGIRVEEFMCGEANATTWPSASCVSPSDSRFAPTNQTPTPLPRRDSQVFRRAPVFE